MTTNKNFTYSIEKRVLIILGFVLAILSLAYVYLINDSIFSVVERKEYEEMIAVTETEVSGLVSKYMVILQDIDEDRASKLGFVRIPDKSIVAIERESPPAFSLLDNGDL